MKKLHDIGTIGEDLACEYLVRKGYKIISRNYKRKFGEIDIIARSKEKTLIFCEVKTLRQNTQIEILGGFSPEDNATRSKLHKMNRIAQFFASKNPLLIYEDKGWQVDLIAISVDGEGKIRRLQHYKNI